MMGVRVGSEIAAIAIDDGCGSTLVERFDAVGSGCAAGFVWIFGPFGWEDIPHVRYRTDETRLLPPALRFLMSGDLEFCSGIGYGLCTHVSFPLLIVTRLSL